MNTLVNIFISIAMIWWLVGTFTYSQWVANQMKLKRDPNAWRDYSAKHIFSLSGKLRAPMYYMFVSHSSACNYTDVDTDGTDLIPVILAGGISILVAMMAVLFGALIIQHPMVFFGTIVCLVCAYGVFQLGKRI